MAARTVHRLEPEKYYYTYGQTSPALRVLSGERVVVKTVDCYGKDEKGRALPASKRQSCPGTELYQGNPLIGPIYVEDARPGDTLAVRIDRIRLNRTTALSGHHPHFGMLTGETAGKALLFNAPLAERFFPWKLDLAKKTGTLRLTGSRTKSVTVKLDPFIGSIGVAPRWGRVELSMTPGEYGGNMDCVETRQGTTLYLPVWAKGAYLAFGDIHAAQGDGELCGSALETTAEVTVHLSVRKGWSIEWPRLEDRTHLMVAASTRPLFDAVALAYTEMVRWMIDDFGFERNEAVQVLSQTGSMRVGNICDPAYTVVAKLPKKVLGIR